MYLLFIQKLIKTKTLLFLATALLSSSLITADEIKKPVRDTLRLFFSEDEADRQEAVNRFKKMGQVAVKQLRQWVLDREEQLTQVRELLGKLDKTGDQKTLDDEQKVLRSYFLKKLEEGWRLLQGGKYGEAADIAEALLALDGQSHREFDYRRLLRHSRRRQLSKEVLEPIVEFSHTVYEFDAEPKIAFQLVNHRDEIRVIQAKGGVLGVLTVSIEISRVNGSYHSERLEIPIRTYNDTQRVVIEGKETHRISVPIPIQGYKPRKGMVMRMKAQGKFRPSQWGVGEKNINHALESAETICWLVPKGEQDLALSPLKKIGVAILLRNIHSFFIAGQLAVWASEDDGKMTDQLVEKLVASLPRLDDFGFKIANRFLISATGVSKSRATSKEFWLEWVKEKARKKNKVEGRNFSPKAIIKNKFPSLPSSLGIEQ